MAARSPGFSMAADGQPSPHSKVDLSASGDTRVRGSRPGRSWLLLAAGLSSALSQPITGMFGFALCLACSAMLIREGKVAAGLLTAALAPIALLLALVLTGGLGGELQPVQLS
jgi:hypothetical protein